MNTKATSKSYSSGASACAAQNSGSLTYPPCRLSPGQPECCWLPDRVVSPPMVDPTTSKFRRFRVAVLYFTRVVHLESASAL
jgi:hypothetical protein